MLPSGQSSHDDENRHVTSIKSDWKIMSIRKSVKSFILKNYLFTDDDSALSDTASLVHAGIVDSTGILELIIHVEEAWGIQVLPEEMVPENFDSVDRVVEFIARKQQVLV